MVAIDDINKLRPELLEISDAEFERRAAEFELARIERQRKREIAEKETLAAEINKHVEMAIEGLKFLRANGRIPERIAEAFSRSGNWAPSAFLKTVTPEDLLPSELKKPRLRAPRMTKAEREAAIAAGTYKPRKRRTKAEMEAASK